MMHEKLSHLIGLVLLLPENRAEHGPVLVEDLLLFPEAAFRDFPFVTLQPDGEQSLQYRLQPEYGQIERDVM